MSSLSSKIFGGSRGKSKPRLTINEELLETTPPKFQVNRGEQYLGYFYPYETAELFRNAGQAVPDQVIEEIRRQQQESEPLERGAEMDRLNILQNILSQLPQAESTTLQSILDILTESSISQAG